MKTNSQQEVIARIAGPGSMLAALLALALALPSASHADPLAPPSVVGVIDNGLYSSQIAILDSFGSVTGTQTFDYGYNPSLDGTTTDTIIASYANGDASISASGSSTGAAGSSPPQLYSQVEVYINFEVVGPESYVSVPVIYSATGTASATGGYATVAFAGYNTSSLIACAPSCGSEPSSFSGTLDGTVLSNEVGDDFALNLYGQSGGNFSGPGSWSATVDPTVEIDPTFLADNPGYSLIIDGNPAGASPAPEPGNLLLLGTGMITLAGMVRRRMSR
jgi:hypothetical protein